MKRVIRGDAPGEVVNKPEEGAANLSDAHLDGLCPDHGTGVRMFGEAIASPQASFPLTETLPGTTCWNLSAGIHIWLGAAPES